MTVLGRKPFNRVSGGAVVPASFSFPSPSSAPPQVFPFEYFGIKDLSGKCWYWFFSPDYVPDWSATRPTQEGAHELHFFSAPWWIRLVSPAADIWYVHPSLDGAPIVVPTQPTINGGLTASPVLHITSQVQARYIVSSGGALDVEIL